MFSILMCMKHEHIKYLLSTPRLWLQHIMRNVDMALHNTYDFNRIHLSSGMLRAIDMHSNLVS